MSFGGGPSAFARSAIVTKGRQDKDSSDVRGLDPRTGATVWTARASRTSAALVNTDDSVYVPLLDGSVGAYDTATGALRWSLGAGMPVAAHGETVYLLANGELQAVTGP